MSFSNSDNPVTPLATYTQVNCTMKATIPDRVALDIQYVQYGKNTDRDLIYFLGHTFEGKAPDSQRGMMFQFSRNIKSGTYLPEDENFPFKQLYYYESAHADGAGASQYKYKAESGIIEVKVDESDAQALRYLIKFNFKGTDNRTQELEVYGVADLNVFMRPGMI